MIGLVAFGSVPSRRELLGGAIMLAGIALPSLAQRSGAVSPVNASGDVT